MRVPRGITTIEIIVVIAILGMMFTGAAIGYSRLQRTAALSASDREVMNLLTTAARHARNGVNGSNWGVYIPYDETTRSATTAVVFSGTSYATRNTTYDIAFSISSDILFTTVDFSGTATNTANSHEIVFQKQTGETTGYGSMTLTWFDTTRTIVINSNGTSVRQ